MIALYPPLAWGELAGDDPVPNLRTCARTASGALLPRIRFWPPSALARTRSSSPCTALAGTYADPGRRPPTAAQSSLFREPSAVPVASSTRFIRQPRPAAFQPRMKASIQLHQLAKVRFSLPPLPMRSPPPCPPPEPRRQHPPSQRFGMYRRFRLRWPGVRRPGSARIAIPGLTRFSAARRCSVAVSAVRASTGVPMLEGRRPPFRYRPRHAFLPITQLLEISPLHTIASCLPLRGPSLPPGSARDSSIACLSQSRYLLTKEL